MLTPKEKNKIIRHILSVNKVKDRFSFIKNEVLRENMSIVFQYITFLISLEIELGAKGSILYSLYKDIILHTATIIESSLHYCLKEFFSAKIIDYKIMPCKWIEEECKDIYKTEDGRRISGIIKHKKYEKLEDRTEFSVINKISKAAGILNDDLFEKAEELRTNRNKIHLVGLKNSFEDFFSKSDVKKSFNNAREILSHIEKKVKTLENQKKSIK